MRYSKVMKCRGMKYLPRMGAFLSYTDKNMTELFLVYMLCPQVPFIFSLRRPTDCNTALSRLHATGSLAPR